MPRKLRQKACYACANAKRKCDKQVPQCERCVDNETQYIYPHYGSRRQSHQGRISIEPSNDRHNRIIAVSRTPSPGNWDSLLCYPPLFPDAPEWLIPQDFAQPMTEVAGDLKFSSFAPPSPTITGLWFLGSESWAKQHCDSGCSFVTDYSAGFIETVQEMLRSWVRRGFNAFIYQRLYDKGAPAHAQDAFVIFAAYVGRTSAVQDRILEIMEQRSRALIHDNSKGNDGSLSIYEHLCRAHALFVYAFIRLFDGSVRMRVSAERQLPILRGWVTQMWEAAKAYRGKTRGLIDQGNMAELDAAIEMWESWILTESVRRSILVIESTANVYQAIAKGWAECSGVIMFTAREGLWGAKSAIVWQNIACTEYPLLASSLTPAGLIS